PMSASDGNVKYSGGAPCSVSESPCCIVLGWGAFGGSGRRSPRSTSIGLAPEERRDVHVHALERVIRLRPHLARPSPPPAGHGHRRPRPSLQIDDLARRSRGGL